MNSKNFVICDREFSYAQRLADCIAAKRELNVQVKVCTGKRQVQECQQEQKIDILLVGEEYLQEAGDETGSAGIGHVFVLTSDPEKASGKNYIYKYQSSDAIMEQMMQRCLDEGEEGLFCVRKNHAGKMVGVYSPVHRIGKTTFAVALGRELARTRSVLYLNMEEYAGELETATGKPAKALDEVLFYARQESGNLGARIASMAGRAEELEYISPMKVSEDLRAVTVNEWRDLFLQLLEKSVYEVLVIDFGESVQGLPELLQMCDVIFTLTHAETVSEAKLRQYENGLRLTGRDEILQKTVKILCEQDPDSMVRQAVREV